MCSCSLKTYKFPRASCSEIKSEHTLRRPWMIYTLSFNQPKKMKEPFSFMCWCLDKTFHSCDISFQRLDLYNRHPALCCLSPPSLSTNFPVYLSLYFYNKSTEDNKSDEDSSSYVLYFSLDQPGEPTDRHSNSACLAQKYQQDQFWAHTVSTSSKTSRHVTC